MAKLFLLGWSLVRVSLCALRGLDLEGCAALLVVVATATYGSRQGPSTW